MANLTPIVIHNLLFTTRCASKVHLLEQICLNLRISIYRTSIILQLLQHGN